MSAIRGRPGASMVVTSQSLGEWRMTGLHDPGRAHLGRPGGGAYIRLEGRDRRVVAGVEWRGPVTRDAPPEPNGCTW
jgi:hypothetical protein